MSSRSPEDSQSVLTGFRKGLSEGGIVEGKDAGVDMDRHADCVSPNYRFP